MVGWGLLRWSQVSVDQSSRKFNKTIISIKKKERKKNKKRKKRRVWKKNYSGHRFMSGTYI